MIGLFEGIEIGSWYRAPGGSAFEVVALDMDAETIEIQYYDGAVEELDFDSWLELGAQPCPAPDNASGALDLHRGDFGDWRKDTTRIVNPLDQLDWQ